MIIERKIGEIFHDGRRKVVCVQAMWESCNGCLYDEEDMQMCMQMRNRVKIIGLCTKERRSDNKSVIFKKADNYDKN